MKYLIPILLFPCLLNAQGTLGTISLLNSSNLKQATWQEYTTEAPKTKVDTVKSLVLCPFNNQFLKYASKEITYGAVKRFNMTKGEEDFIWVPESIAWIEDVKGCYDLSGLKIENNIKTNHGKKY